MQLVASVGLIVIGLLLGLVLHSSAEMRLFGWIVVAIGVLGLVARWWLARLRDDQAGKRGR